VPKQLTVAESVAKLKSILHLDMNETIAIEKHDDLPGKRVFIFQI